jgi:molybdopterin synthase catalytic subunit
MTTGAGASGVVLAEVRETPLSVDEVVRAVRHPAAGAVVTFIGYVRERDHGEAVEVLDYTSHPTAEEVARALAERLASEGRVIRLGVVHRTGHLVIGDIAVVAAVSAEHRREAFEVCHALIDEFKATVPIWKHQSFTDGSDEWVGLP